MGIKGRKEGKGEHIKTDPNEKTLRHTCNFAHIIYVVDTSMIH